MSSSVPLPQKEDIPKDVWRLASTLSNEMQTAALRKARELGFDLNKGRIPLEETLNNLSHNRDIILDAVDKNKLVQLPLKLQYVLYSQTQKISEALNSLVNGTDSLLSLEDSVDELTATVWQYNLHNLSDQVLGFHNKMNQLKSLETVIRRAHREAEEFETSNAHARELLAQIEEVVSAAGGQVKSAQESASQVQSVLTKVLEQEQKINAIALQGQQHDSAAAQFSANAKTAAADVEAIAGKARALQAEIDTARSQFMELQEKAAHVLSTTEKTARDSLNDFQQAYAVLKGDVEAQTTALRETLQASVQGFISSADGKVEAAVSALQKRSAENVESINELVSDVSGRLTKTQQHQESRSSEQLRELDRKAAVTEQELKENCRVRLDEITEKSEKVIAANVEEHKRLVIELDSLEGRIRESIERATGYTLFHSFQKRQLDLAKSKKFWGIALAIAVAVSLGASGYFIYSLRFVQVYNAAFYLKLSISLPLIYAIAFCNLQYSRERRLEEEYAFKSNISISLEPYQKLVEQLIDKEKPEERSKYTAFIIESVNRVFTSPTSSIFDDQSKDKNSAEKIIKAVGDVIDPLAKALKK